MKTIISISVGLCTGIAIYGVSLALAWKWFMVPLGLPASLSFGHAMGLVMVTVVITNAHTIGGQAPISGTLAQAIWGRVISQVLLLALMWLCSLGVG